MTQKNKIAKNTTWSFVFNIAKILFPFITLPYLTRVLSTETYGVVTYVKTIMTYMQIFVDFGFILSGTKDIVKELNKKNGNVGTVIADTMAARITLGILGFVLIFIISLIIPILRENLMYTILSYFVVFESIFLLDFVFKGYEKIHIIAIRFLTMKTITTLLTFLFIKKDTDMIYIPIMDIISSTVSILLVYYEYSKFNIKTKMSNFINVCKKIKESFVYFLSSAATTSFNALGTIIVGIMLTKSEIAYWGVCMQIVGTIQALYNPIVDGIYPEMIRTKNLNIIKRTFCIFGPIVVIGCIVSYIMAPIGMKILGGIKYINAVPIFRILIPCLLFCFPSVMFGWPTVGAIGKQSKVTKSTIISIAFNIIAMMVLIFIDKFTLINIAIIRVCTEIVMLLARFRYFLKYKKEFIIKQV